MVVILSPFFAPEPISTGKYNTELAIALKNAGVEPWVICSYPFYPEWKIRASTEAPAGIKILRGGRFMRYPSNVWLRRIALEIWFAIFCVSKIPILFRAKQIIAIVPPSLFLYLMPKFICSKCAVIVHDLQLVHLGSASNSRIKSILAAVIKRVEKLGFQSANTIHFLSQEMRTEAVQTYALDKSKTFVMYPPVTVSEFTVEGALDDIFSSSDATIVYSGALGEKQNAEMLLELAESIVKKMENVRFLFFSRGPVFEKLRRLSFESRVEFYDLVPESNVGELLLRSTVQVIPQAPGTSKGSLPSKLPNILASGCQALVITDSESELSEILQPVDGVAVSNTWDVEANVRALEALIASGTQTDKDTVRSQRASLLRSFDRGQVLNDILRG